MRWPRVTYVGDIADATARAKEAAESRNVLVHGEVTARMALAAGVRDPDFSRRRRDLDFGSWPLRWLE